MHCVVNDDAKRHGDDNRHRQGDIADHEAPQAEAHDRRHQVRYKRDEPELEVAEHKEDDKGYEDKRERGALQHRRHVTGRDHGVDMGLAGDRALQLGCVLVEPGLNLFVECDELAGRRVADKSRNPGRGTINIDLVGQVHAITKRQLVQEQELRGFLVAVRNPVEGFVIAVHVHVQPLDRIAQRPDMADLGLVAKEG